MLRATLRWQGELGQGAQERKHPLVGSGGENSQMKSRRKNCAVRVRGKGVPWVVSEDRCVLWGKVKWEESCLREGTKGGQYARGCQGGSGWERTGSWLAGEHTLCSERPARVQGVSTSQWGLGAGRRVAEQWRVRKSEGALREGH